MRSRPSEGDEVNVGCTRIAVVAASSVVPRLERLTVVDGNPKPRKLLIGYSDVTALHEFVRRRWGWATLHAPMPAEANFGQYPAAHWRGLVDLVRGKHPGAVWEERPLTW